MESTKGRCEAAWKYSSSRARSSADVRERGRLEPGSVNGDNLASSLVFCTSIWMTALAFDQELAWETFASLSCVSTRGVVLSSDFAGSVTPTTRPSIPPAAAATPHSPHVKLISTKMSTSIALITCELAALRSVSRRGTSSREALFMG